MQEKTCGELSKKALSDETKVDPLDIAFALTDDLHDQFIESIKLHQRQIRESKQEEFCLTYVMCFGDYLVKNLIRKKFYIWPFLPSPRPSQGVFLYNKTLGQITKRLWVLPNAFKMSELASDWNRILPEEEYMQKCCRAFFAGKFWEFIRYHHEISMISQHEYFQLHREELAKLGIDISNPDPAEPFDFSKISFNNVTYPKNPCTLQGS